MTAPDLEEVIQLEQSLADDLVCEVRHDVELHRSKGLGPCTVKVVARKFNCVGWAWACEEITIFTTEIIARSIAEPYQHICITCDRFIHECWRMVSA